MTKNVKIAGIFASNFKNIEGDFSVELDGASPSSLLLLGGPNGYGKTTIFDILEICIRGEIRRIQQFKDVEADKASYDKMPLVNKKGVDATVGIMLQEVTNDESKHHVFRYRYPGSSIGKIGNARANKALGFFDLLECYYSEDSSTFGSKDFEQNEKVEIAQASNRLANLLYQGRKLPNESYLLFNYVQQEDNIYYLKMKEKEKADSLDFLFQTEKMELAYARLHSLGKLIGGKLVAELKELTKNIQQEVKQEEVLPIEVHSLLFPDLEDLEWDVEHPFEATKPDELASTFDGFKKQIGDLVSFVSNFSPIEFEKRANKRLFEKETTDKSLLRSLLCRDFLADKELEKRKSASEKGEKLRRYFSFLGLELKEGRLVEIALVDRAKTLTGDGFRNALMENDFVTRIDEYDALKLRVIELQKLMGDLASKKAALKDAQKRMLEDLQGINKLHPFDAVCNCPLCGWPYDSFLKLEQAILDQIATSESVNDLISSERDERLNQIESEFWVACKQKVKKEYEDSERIQFANDYSELKALFKDSTRLENLSAVLAKNGLPIDKLSIEQPINKIELDKRLADLASKIESAIESIGIDETKLQNEDLFSRYFNKDATFFASITIEKLASKRIYLAQQFRTKSNESLGKLEARIERLQKIGERLERERTAFNKGIKDYKAGMVKMLLIPLYVYSAKILQNCPQGDGIFLNWKEDRGSATFEIDNYSPTPTAAKHDIVHHLSTGQMAVVSIAFCLALNKISQTPFKFIAIDDPLQTLDDLNIHSFIELVRHDFKGYQLLFSTHEEHAARYLLYRFHKAGFATKYLDVKKKFLENNAAS